MANEQNLRPIQKGQLSEEELKKRQKNGGKKSVEVRRKKKLMKEIYAAYLAKEHDIIINGKNKKIAGQKLIDNVINKVLSKGDMASVLMLKEIRESTEEKDFDINKFFGAM